MSAPPSLAGIPVHISSQLPPGRDWFFHPDLGHVLYVRSEEVLARLVREANELGEAVTDKLGGTP